MYLENCFCEIFEKKHANLDIHGILCYTNKNILACIYMYMMCATVCDESCLCAGAFVCREKQDGWSEEVVGGRLC